MMKRWVKVIVLVVLLILAMLIARNTANISTNSVMNDTSKSNKEVEKIEEKEHNDEIEVVATLADTIKTNSAWCGTFQLVWNDMQDEVVKQDIVFQKQLEIVENLNKQTFTEDDISEEYYYKKYGLMTLDLKTEIENGLKEKFDEPSDILEQLDWSNAPQDDSGYDESSRTYLFYAMLYREFNFDKEFSELDNDTFEGTKETYEDVEYFGIDADSSELLYSQVDVLYYNSKEDFAVILNTKEDDEIILAKGNNGNTFSEIYDIVVNEKSKEYSGKDEFSEYDTLKVPNLNLDVLKHYDELIANGNPDKMFYSSEGRICEINDAIQTIKMTLDKSGGKIKSEAAIVMTDTAAMIGDEPKVEHRYFEFDSEFTIFIRENGKDLPYFAANIDDITLFQ